MNSKNIIIKEIKTTLKEIELFSSSKCFTIRESNSDYLTDSKLKINWDKQIDSLDFKLELANEIRPDEVNFKKIGLNDDIVISSKERTFVIPSHSINNITTKRFVASKKIEGVITCLFHKSLKYSDLKHFRLLVNISDENVTTFFSGRRYECGDTPYGHGLTSLRINNHNFDIFRCETNTQKKLVIESLDKIDFKSFQKTSKAIIKGLALLSGNWYRDKYFIVASDNPSFNAIDSVHYESLQKSIITDLGLIKPFENKLYREEVNNTKSLLTDNLFPASIFSKIIEKSLSNPSYNRTIEMIIECSNNESVIIRSSMYYVALEAIVGIIYNENKSKLKPIKDTKVLDDLLDKIAKEISNYENKFTDKELEVINKKIEHLNTPFNTDKPLKIFELYKIKLSDKFIKILKNRNKFLHGSVPYSEDEFKNNLLEINLDSFRIRLLATILILKYVNYSGHIRNLAGQFLFDTNRLNDGTIDFEESIYYEI